MRSTKKEERRIARVLPNGAKRAFALYEHESVSVTFMEYSPASKPVSGEIFSSNKEFHEDPFPTLCKNTIMFFSFCLKYVTKKLPNITYSYTGPIWW